MIENKVESISTTTRLATEHKWWRRVAIFASVTAVVGLVLAGTPSVRGYARAGLLVLDLLSPTSESVLRGITPSPTFESIFIPVGDKRIKANYYRPSGSGPHGALILVLGFPSEINDGPLNQVAENLARLGVATLIPLLPNLRTGELSISDVQILVNAFKWLRTQPEISPEHIGFGGFCVGSSLALLAAEDPQINEDVALINVFGGYYHLPSYVRAIAARSAYYNGQEYPWNPATDTVMLLTRNVLLSLDRPEDVTAIQVYFTEDNSKEISLSPEGEWALQFLTSWEPETVDTLLSQLPVGMNSRLNNLSPSNGIERLHANLYIMHDLSDPYVPSIEANRLFKSAPNPSQTRFSEFVLFNHVRLDVGTNRLSMISDATKLVFFLGPLLKDLEPILVQ